jgi:SLA1 homology domain 1, SHD1
VSLDDGVVKLKKRNGELVSVPLAKLSKADQEFIAKVESLKTGKSKTSNK